ncbi:hypothetical protein [Subtercola frigoramans]|uniref:Uncharacterized protein n=1 Tax=Subtercola frigoramans TaxID=120298 RepID=A0ABS2L0R6_9MICO|nr:hypothetical protein [Subtercola frigoramans]MBM7470634.1 hypothetical protein [Subtercola frigoramans]
MNQPTSTSTSASDDRDLDAVEHEEDQRERAQFDKSAKDAGLLPAPEAVPTDSPAPGA